MSKENITVVFERAILVIFGLTGALTVIGVCWVLLFL